MLNHPSISRNASLHVAPLHLQRRSWHLSTAFFLATSRIETRCHYRIMPWFRQMIAEKTFKHLMIQKAALACYLQPTPLQMVLIQRHRVLLLFSRRSPAWMRLPPANKPPSATLTKQAELRSHVDPAFVHFHNPTLECCSFHHPDNSYLIENEKRANALAAVTHPDGQPPIRSDGTFPPLQTADQKKEARSELKRWRICVTGSMLVAHSVTPPSTILPDHRSP